LKTTHATDSYSVGEIINEGLVRQPFLYVIILFSATTILSAVFQPIK